MMKTKVLNSDLRNILLKLNYLVLDESKKSSTINNNALLILNSFRSLGYSLSKDAIDILSNQDDLSLTNFYHTNFKLLKNSVCDISHNIFYKNFPYLAKMSDADYIIRAYLHYMSATESDFGFIDNTLKVNKRKDKIDCQAHILDVIKFEDALLILKDYFTKQLESVNSISYPLAINLISFSNTYNIKLEPKDIPFKENIEIYFASLKTSLANKSLSFDDFKYCKTLHDVLRCYISLSKGSYFINNSKFKFISLPRYARRLFLNKLDSLIMTDRQIDDILKDRFLWLKAFEYLHVFEYPKYKKIYHFANLLRNYKNIGYNSELNKYKDNEEKLLDLLSIKPGVFARNLDMLLRNPNFNKENILASFKKIGNQVSNKVLVELYNFYLNRNSSSTRLFKIVGEYVSYTEIEDNRANLDEKTIRLVLATIEEILSSSFNNLPKLDKVYLDPNLKYLPVPSNNRNTSFSFNNYIYGQQIKLETEKFIRIFTNWHNIKNERVDVDLAVEIFDANLKYITSLAWHNMSGGKFIEAYHSGDLVTAPGENGASEFVDLNLEKAKKGGVKYLIATNTIYTGQSFAEVKPYCGVMFTENRLKGIFNPKAVKIKSILTHQSANMVAGFIIDIENMSLIWLDTPVDFSYYSTSATNLNVKFILNDTLKNKMNLYDFYLLHKGHIEFVDDISKANNIIGINNQANINALEYLTNFFLSANNINWYILVLD